MFSCVFLYSQIFFHLVKRLFWVILIKTYIIIIIIIILVVTVNSLTIINWSSFAIVINRCLLVTKPFLSDYALEDHVIKTFYTLPEDLCLAKCNLNKRCRSVSYNKKRSSNLDCQLNSATNQQYPKSYKPRPGWVYIENKVRSFFNFDLTYTM